MAYIRKTVDEWQLQSYYPAYGWETIVYMVNLQDNHFYRIKDGKQYYKLSTMYRFKNNRHQAIMEV